MQFKSSLRRGFTVVELIIVVVVVAVLATLVIVGYSGLTNNARDKSLLSDIDSVESELARYATKNSGLYSPALAWNSSSGTNANIRFTPTSGNVIIVSVTTSSYCIRAYNPSSSTKTLDVALRKESRQGACGWSSVAANESICGMYAGGDFYCWGYNATGGLNVGTTTNTLSPTPLVKNGALTGKTLTSVAATTQAGCGIATDNLAYCWGKNIGGRLGNGTTVDSVNNPVAVSRAGVLAGKTIKKIVQTGNSNFSAACVIASDNLAYCWGPGTRGQLGNGLNTDSSVPVAVDMSGALSGKTIKDIDSSSYGNVCVIASDDNAYCWGWNAGRTGDGTSTTSTLTPVAVSRSGALSGKTIKSISVGGWQTCVIASDNKPYCWGAANNLYGSIGDGTSADAFSPTAVVTSGALNGATVNSLSSGEAHVCVTSTSKQAYCWGTGTNGRLGNGSSTLSRVPVLVNQVPFSSSGISQIIAGFSGTCAIDTSSDMYCWGANNYGQFGNGTVTPATSTVPVLIPRPS